MGNDNKILNVHNFGKDKPLFTTAIVASMLNITPDRLRTYDAEKLIHTYRIKTGEVERRLYTQYDVEWLQGIRILIKKYKMSISSIKYILLLIKENKKIKFPKREVSGILFQLAKNPNFSKVVKNI